MSDDAYEAVVIVTRRVGVPLEPPAPVPFVCCICQRTIKPSPWARGIDTRPICTSCTDWWSGPLGRFSGTTRGDQTNLARLKAVTSRINWEICNGKRPQ